MNPEFEKAGTELVEWMTGVAKGGGDFLAEQAPLLAQEIVAWEFWSNVFLIGLIGLPALTVAIVLGRLCVKEAHRSHPDGDPGLTICLGLVTALSAIIACFAIGIHGHAAVKAAVAPRLVIIEYAGSVINGK